MLNVALNDNSRGEGWWGGEEEEEEEEERKTKKGKRREKEREKRGETITRPGTNGDKH
jgi:hypothetical protein